MLSIHNAKGHFRLRSVALFRRENEVLLLNEPLIGTYWFLPGGCTEMHESTKAAIEREIREELGSDAEVGSLQYVIENFFTVDSTVKHILNFVYVATLPTTHPLHNESDWSHFREEDGMLKEYRFQWYPLASLEKLDLRPSIFKKILLQTPKIKDIQHIVFTQTS